MRRTGVSTRDRFREPVDLRKPRPTRASEERIARIRQGTLLESEFQFTGKTNAEMASPLYEALSAHIADSAPSAGACARTSIEHPPDLSAVHHLVLLGAAHPLSEYFPSAGGTRSPDGSSSRPSRTSSTRTRRYRATLARTRRSDERGPQMRDAVAGLHCRLDEGWTPLALIELGCSSGLNLMFDRYGYRY